jgi:uncharacterized membrane protein
LYNGLRCHLLIGGTEATFCATGAPKTLSLQIILEPLGCSVKYKNLYEKALSKIKKNKKKSS